MGRVRAAGFRQRGLRETAGQHRRPAQGDRDFVFQGSGCRLGETGNPDRPQGRWQGSVWPVGHSNQHYGKPISKTGPSLDDAAPRGPLAEPTAWTTTNKAHTTESFNSCVI